MTATFVLATANPDKAREMREVLTGLGVDLLERPGHVLEIDETGDTLEENALLKARALVDATGYAAIADDTGLFVDALEGRPGVRSARYAGEAASYSDNVVKLLDQLNGVVLDRRTARFRTVIAVAFVDGHSFTVEGVLEGRITEAPRGDQGFGYDPVFAPAHTEERTLAEMANFEKNRISHRAIALRALALELAQT